MGTVAVTVLSRSLNRGLGRQSRSWPKSPAWEPSSLHITESLSESRSTGFMSSPLRPYHLAQPPTILRQLFKLKLGESPSLP